MNFYNPYFYSLPTSTTGSLLSKLSLSSIINGTSKTLNLINQTIPIIKQVSPMMKNAKTMFNIMNEFRKTDPTIPTQVSDSKMLEKTESVVNSQENYPTFFV